MKKEIVKRSLLGIPLGITISYLLSIIISYLAKSEDYIPCAPAFLALFESSLQAVCVQTLFSALIGAIFSAASLIWEIESWSLLKQSFIHFLCMSITMFPIAWFMHWMSHTVFGVLTYSVLFFILYLCIWLILYQIQRKEIQRMNQHLKKRNEKRTGQTSNL